MIDTNKDKVEEVEDVDLANIIEILLTNFLGNLLNEMTFYQRKVKHSITNKIYPLNNHLEIIPYIGGYLKQSK